MACRQIAQKIVANSFCTKRVLSTSSVGFKYSSTSGVKGIKGKKFNKSSLSNDDDGDADGEPETDGIDLDENRYTKKHSELN